MHNYIKKTTINIFYTIHTVYISIRFVMLEICQLTDFSVRTDINTSTVTAIINTPRTTAASGCITVASSDSNRGEFVTVLSVHVVLIAGHTVSARAKMSHATPDPANASRHVTTLRSRFCCPCCCARSSRIRMSGWSPFADLAVNAEAP